MQRTEAKLRLTNHHIARLDLIGKQIGQTPDIKEIILCKENEKDLEDLPEEVREALQFHLVERMDEVLRLALDGELVSRPPGDAGINEGASDTPVDSGSVAH